ncbi:MAG: hypothetical protein PWP24_2009 [Clostridiales bacterium]|nr:hypothetical protein [Clostridiales bacterium]
MNYLLLDSSHIQMEFGILGDVSHFHTYRSGELESVTLAGKNIVLTHAGELVPAYQETARRKKKPSIEFHKNGMIKAVALEEQSEVETPIGSLPAEYVTFYPMGELHRVLVCNGQISGFWTEEEEREYAIPLSFAFDFAQFSARLNGICFYQTGEIKSITLYPKERISVVTPAGAVETEIGFSLYQSGKIQSIEPKSGTKVMTPIGEIIAADSDANGINADSNSLSFDQKGRIVSVKTIQSKIMVQSQDARFFMLEAKVKSHPLYDDQTIQSAMQLTFDYERETVQVNGIESMEFSIPNDNFIITHIAEEAFGCSPIDCASCSLCNTKKEGSV